MKSLGAGDPLALAGDVILNELGGVSLDMRDAEVREALEQVAGARIRQVDDETLEQLRTSLSEGVANGETLEQMKARVEAVFADQSKPQK